MNERFTKSLNTILSANIKEDNNMKYTKKTIIQVIFLLKKLINENVHNRE